MSQNQLTITGLAELKAALAALPRELADEGAAIIVGHATHAATQIQAAYPTGPTGNLVRGVKVEVQTSRFGTQAKVINRAPHAYWYENGTEARHYTGPWKHGKFLGKARPKHVFVPRVIKERRAMEQSFVGLLEAHGLMVIRG
jgi:hypothetical protein